MSDSRRNSSPFPFVYPPTVNFSALTDEDVLFCARRMKVKAEDLRQRIMVELRRHGLDLVAENLVWSRWLSRIDGLDVTYDVGPGDAIMVVRVKSADEPLVLEGLYAQS